jgi:hypothetical protein
LVKPEFEINTSLKLCTLKFKVIVHYIKINLYEACKV